MRVSKMGYYRTDEIDHSVTTGDFLRHNTKITVGERFSLEPLSTIRGVVHVVRSNYSVKPFGGSVVWPYH